jgi:hypothetical protein
MQLVTSVRKKDIMRPYVNQEAPSEKSRINRYVASEPVVVLELFSVETLTAVYFCNVTLQRQGFHFITALHTLSEHCGYGDMRDQLIRDFIVVGIRDDKLSEKMQLDPDLTLEKAISLAKKKISRRPRNLYNISKYSLG